MYAGVGVTATQGPSFLHSLLHLLAIRVIRVRLVLLGGLLLRLLLLVLLASVAAERLLEELEDLLVSDLLVGLVLAHIKLRRGTELGDTVLGDGYSSISSMFAHVVSLLGLTKSGQKTSHGGILLVSNQLVLAENVATDALNDTGLGITLVLKLTQAEGEGTELLLHLREDFPRCRALETIGLQRAAVKSRALSIDVLDLARAQAYTYFHAPDLTDLGDAIALGTLARCQDDLLGALDLVVAEQPRGGALNNVAVVALADGLEHARDLSLRRSLLAGGLGLLFFRSLGKKTRGGHQPQEELIAVVSGQHQVSWASGDLLASLILRSGEHSVADDGAEAINLSSELDLDGLAGLDLGGGLSLVGGEGCVRSDVGCGRDGGRVREACYPVNMCF